MGTSFTMTTGCCRCGRPVARRFLSLADKPSGAFEDVDVVPHAAAAAASAVISRVPFVPAALEWLHVGRASVVMDTGKAKSELGWSPKYTSAETLAALAAAY
jgi:nucleoside-diphosphate-sugar epimerase